MATANLTFAPAPRVITATEIVYGARYTPRPYNWEPQHPTLVVLDWECELTDIHGVAGGQHGVDIHGRGSYSFDCACGWTGPKCATILDASAAIISHALNTCAACGGPKPAASYDGRMDVFPRCSSCAF